MPLISEILATFAGKSLAEFRYVRSGGCKFNRLGASLVKT